MQYLQSMYKLILIDPKLSEEFLISQANNCDLFFD